MVNLVLSKNPYVTRKYPGCLNPSPVNKLPLRAFAMQLTVFINDLHQDECHRATLNCCIEKFHVHPSMWFRAINRAGF